MRKFTQEDLREIHRIALGEMQNFPVVYGRLPEFSDSSVVRAYCYYMAVNIHLKNKGLLKEVGQFQPKTYIKL